MERLDVLTLMGQIPDEASAYEFMERLRWNGTPVCSHCGSTKTYFLTPANGTDRATSTGARTVRRLHKCGDCRKKFTVTTGTVMQGSKIPLRTWVLVMVEVCSAKNGIAAREVERRYNLCPRSAWHLLHRIREAMRAIGLDTLGGDGTVIVADETYIGGSARNRHKGARSRKPTGEPTPVKPGERNPNPLDGKAMVLSLIDTASGEVRSRVIRDVTSATLRKHLSEQVDMAGSILHTDEWQGYRQVGAEFAAHEAVNHSKDEYVRYDRGRVITSNAAEGYFSQLKRSVSGTFHRVSSVHLHRYLSEFDYRYSTRKMSDTDRFVKMVGQMEGRRLTYKRATAAA